MTNVYEIQDENVAEIVELVRTVKQPKKLRKALEDYHDNDIANALAELTTSERLTLYQVIGIERTADVISYLDLDNVYDYIREINIDDAAKI
ncbi:MAG: hypothetical protein IJI05_00835, partial [Erysipelotrichaceae bacterium]|nr:hypothetical protein [Erysipelotrichaceae bacterium]